MISVVDKLLTKPNICITTRNLSSIPPHLENRKSLYKFKMSQISKNIILTQQNVWITLKRDGIVKMALQEPSVGEIGNLSPHSCKPTGIIFFHS